MSILSLPSVIFSCKGARMPWPLIPLHSQSFCLSKLLLPSLIQLSYNLLCFLRALGQTDSKGQDQHLPQRLFLPLQPWFWRKLEQCPDCHPLPVLASLPTCSLSMASSGPIWGSAVGENEGSSSPLCGGGDEGEAGAGGDDAAGRTAPGLPSSTFRPGRETGRRG